MSPASTSGGALRVRRVESRRATPEEMRAITELVNATWPREAPAPGARAMPPVEQDKTHVTIWDGDTLAAHAAFFPRTVRHVAGEFVVMALAGVCVPKDRRGAGLGRRVVLEAFRDVDAGLFRVSLFQTTVPDFYRRLGAVTVGNRFFNSRHVTGPGKTPWWDPHVMIYPAWTGWPAGDIDLNGPGY